MSKLLMQEDKQMNYDLVRNCVTKDKFKNYFKETVIEGKTYTVHEVEIPISQVVPHQVNGRYAHSGGVSQAKQNQSKAGCK